MLGKPTPNLLCLCKSRNVNIYFFPSRHKVAFCCGRWQASNSKFHCTNAWAQKQSVHLFKCNFCKGSLHQRPTQRKSTWSTSRVGFGTWIQMPQRLACCKATWYKMQLKMQNQNANKQIIINKSPIQQDCLQSHVPAGARHVPDVFTYFFHGAHDFGILSKFMCPCLSMLSMFAVAEVVLAKKMCNKWSASWCETRWHRNATSNFMQCFYALRNALWCKNLMQFALWCNASCNAFNSLCGSYVIFMSPSRCNTTQKDARQWNRVSSCVSCFLLKKHKRFMSFMRCMILPVGLDSLTMYSKPSGSLRSCKSLEKAGAQRPEI